MWFLYNLIRTVSVFINNKNKTNVVRGTRNFLIFWITHLNSMLSILILVDNKQMRNLFQSWKTLESVWIQFDNNSKVLKSISGKYKTHISKTSTQFSARNGNVRHGMERLDWTVWQWQVFSNIKRMHWGKKIPTMSADSDKVYKFPWDFTSDFKKRWFRWRHSDVIVYFGGKTLSL